ncbi:hypothetical protein Tco_0876402 [Tanacetum coccineum]|uniref:Uncharacterized protein n=1 Tax=Tanacetum coccineum TaxID=301880 RepID=A0ABQ5BSE8_9ASTR
MLAPSGGGLILYQAYGNLYAMTDSKEPTYQVVLDALALTTYYPAFLITADVLVIYMQQLWVTNNKHGSSYQFKIGKKMFSVDMKVFREILQIYPRLPDQEFDEPPSEEEILSFIKELGHTGNIKNITAVVVDHMHQPWRTFASIINKCLSGKITDFAFQIDNKDAKKQEKMYYSIFTKAIIHHFLSKDKSVSMRNIMFMHIAQDDSILGILRFVSKDEDTQVYGALIPVVMTTPKIQDSPAYQTYLAFATGAATPKPKRIYKKPASPIIKTTTTSPKETPSKKKSASAKKDVSSKKPSRKQSTAIQIKDTLGVSVSKKKAPATTEKSKGIDLLSGAALLEDAQMKKVLKQSKMETHFHQASGSGDGAGSQLKVPDELQDKTIDTNEGAESREDDDSNDDDSDDDNDDDGGDNDSDCKRTESDEDENPSLNQNDDDKEEEYEDEYVRTPANYESTDDKNEHVNEEEYYRIDKDLDKDVNVELKDVEHETTYDQVEDEAHVTLTAAHVTQKTKVPLQSSSVSSDFATQFQNLDNVPPADNEIIFMMNVDVCHEEPSNQTPLLLTIPVMVIPETSTATATTTPLPIPPFTPLPQPSTPTPIPTKTSIPALPDFSSIFQFNQRVFNLEKELPELKQADQSAQLLATIKSQILAMVDAHLGTRLGDSIQKALWSYTAKFEKEAQAEKKRYINLIEKSVKDIINNEVKTQLPQILPKAVSDFATPVIKSTVTKSLEDVVLAKSSSQPQSTYEATTSLTEFELKKILIDKMEKSQSNLIANEHKELDKALVNSYNVDKDLFLVYGKAVSLKRGHEDKDKDEDPPAGSD